MVSFSAETAEEEDVVYEILVERFALVVTVLVVEKETQADTDIEKQVGSEDVLGESVAVVGTSEAAVG